MAGQYHEPQGHLSARTLDIKRAIDSMMEELEAVDWYRQRADRASDAKLREILDHHQREEIEHFSMLLEWVRRNDPDFAEQLGTYLFSEGDILHAEESASGADAGQGESSAASPVDARTIGTLKEGS